MTPSRYGLIVCFCLPLLPPTMVQAQFNHTTNGGTIAITRYTGSDSEVAIPSTMNGLPVTSIGFEAFTNYNSLTRVIIPRSVTSIEDFAFRDCTNLAGIIIPEGVISVGDSAFIGCTRLASVTIPGSVSRIGIRAFAFCPSLGRIMVEERNSFYSSMAGVLFNKNQSTLVQFPGGKGGDYTIPGSVTNVGSSAFAYCFNLASVTIPVGVSKLGDSAFYQCVQMTNVIIGKSVTDIENNAFFGCINLTSVAIPDSVAKISDYVFANCQSLVAITVGARNPVYTSVDGVLFNKSQTTLVEYPGGKGARYVIPGGVTNIGDDAFANCTDLTGVLVPDSVTRIGVHAFHECTSLTRIYFKGNAPGIDATSFSGDGVATVYHLENKSGWGEKFGGRPTALWKP